MFSFLVAIHVIASILIVILILMQPASGGGLSDAFGGGGSTMQNLFGVKSRSVLVKITIFLSALFLITSLLITIIGRRQGVSLMERYRIEEETQTTPEESLPDNEIPLSPDEGFLY